MKILCDMDSVLVDMVPTWLVKYNAVTGEGVSEDDVNDWKIDYCVQKPELLTKIMEEDDFFLHLPPMRWSKIYFKKLLKEHDVMILTQPPRQSETGMESKRDWMRRYFPEFDVRNMIFAHRKEVVVGADLLFDDNPKHLQAWRDNNPNGITVAMDYRYNQGFEVDKRVMNWMEFYEYIQTLKR